MPTQDQYGLMFDPYGRLPPPPGQPPRLVLAPTGCLETLVYELRRYLSGQIEGRSCLVAGPRGSGKTTLINRAYQEVVDAISGMRLILVRLHGPSLLVPPPPSGKKAVPEDVNRHVLRTL